MTTPHSFEGSGEPSLRTQPSLSNSPMPPSDVIFGSSPAMLALHHKIRKLAAVNIPVLLTGESGTGKGTIAGLIHSYSREQHGPFVQINCAALPASLIESELFGYEKGSFTGATNSKRGRVESAESGTLFLDEIAELDSRIQAKLLHLLQDGHFTRIGGAEERHSPMRFVFASNRNLQLEIASGNFREDLFYRIDGMTLQLPPLRERAEDIPKLTNYFLGKYGERYHCCPKAFSSSGMERLQSYWWPGNIRQLENVVRRYVVLGSEIAVLADLNDDVRDVFHFSIPPHGKVALKEITRRAVRQVERQVIAKALHVTGWNRKAAAKILKISYRAFLYKLEEAGICCPDESAAPEKVSSIVENQNRTAA
ncbi:MAG: sigma-54 interaction domain-containing protein [Terriglobales bacterium]